MKHKLTIVFAVMLSLMLSACITDFSPEESVVELNSGETQTFNATSDNKYAKLVWYLDGKQVGYDTGQYTFMAEENTGDDIIKHELVVREKNPKIERLLAQLGYKHVFHSIVWEIKIFPDTPPEVCYLDEDGDNFGDINKMVQSDDPPANCIEDNTDCNDDDPQVYPGAEEICDNDIDDDCDGVIDEGCQPQDTYYQDADMDSYGNPEVSVIGPQEGYVLDNTDCDDNDPNIHPGAEEICENSIDDNCNGQIDENCQPQDTYYQDADQDGFGNPEISVIGPQEGYVLDNTDCDDTNAAVNPDAEEVCNEIDDNCNDLIDEGVTTTFFADTDGDTYGDPAAAIEACSAPDNYVTDSTDCDDTIATVNPGAVEVCYNGIDDNCNNQIDENCQPPETYYQDADLDGFGNPEVSVIGPQEGYVDNNTDCDDTNAAINPGAQEICNEIDDNCNDQIDEGVLNTFFADADGDTYGDAADTTEACSAPEGYVADSSDCDDDNAAVNPGAEEICNEVDDNCNGQIDEGVTTTFFADTDGDTYGDAASSTEACIAPEGFVVDNTDCNDGNIEINPGAEEICNEIDDNCNGLVDADEPGVVCDVIPSTVENVTATDIESGLTYINVSWDASEHATYYNVYRAIWEEDATYDLIEENVTGTSCDFHQTWEEVYDAIGPTPAMEPDADVDARGDFIAALEAYRQQALPVLFDFKVPAFFKIEACNDLGCSELSAADEGQAEFIHTEAFSEVAEIIIPSWGYPMLKALADSPPGAQALSWCGLDICGAAGGMVMGRLDQQGLPQVDVYYENYIEGWDEHPTAQFWAHGSIRGRQELFPAIQGIINVSGQFDVGVGAMDAQIYAYSHIGGTVDDNDGFIEVTYNGMAYQFTLPLQPLPGEQVAAPPEPVVPLRDDAVPNRDTAYPVPFEEEPNTECANWTDDLIVNCDRIP